jgi:hypothetical protein
VSGWTALGLLLGIAVVIWFISFRTCLPEPGNDIEWLRREDAVIIQMRHEMTEPRGLPRPEIDKRTELPYLTLYGDGTLVSEDPGTGGLMQANLSDGTIRDLLEYIKDQGFMDFGYEQPLSEVYDQETTFLYANTIGAANSVSAYALGLAADEEGAEWNEVRRLKKIVERISRVKDDALSGEEATPYVPDEARLIAVSMAAADLPGVPPWPFPGIDVPVGEEGEVVERSLSSNEVDALMLEDESQVTCWRGVQYQMLLRDVCYRPVLPYEEHFPEFDTQPTTDG